jgi:hypothetical protein
MTNIVHLLAGDGTLSRIIQECRAMDRDTRARRIQQSIELSLAYNSVGVHFVNAEEDPFPYHCVALTTSNRTGEAYCLDPSAHDPRRISRPATAASDSGIGSAPASSPSAPEQETQETSINTMAAYLNGFLNADRTLRPYTRVLALTTVPGTGGSLNKTASKEEKPGSDSEPSKGSKGDKKDTAVTLPRATPGVD